MLAADPDIRRLMALRAVEGGLRRLKWLAAATRFELVLFAHDLVRKPVPTFRDHAPGSGTTVR